MRLGFFKRPKPLRGKSKSVDAKLKEGKARIELFYQDNWLKQLKDNPELAQRMAEQHLGQEYMSRYNRDEEDGGGGGDLLDVLRQAREVKDMLRDEMGEGKGSWLRDLAEIAKALPTVLAALPQIQQAVTQAQGQGRAQGQTVVTGEQRLVQEQIAAARAAQIVEPKAQSKVESATEEKLPLSLESLVPLVDMSPEDAWSELVANDERGWIYYLSHTPSEDILAQFEKLAELAGNEEQKAKIRDFVRQKHEWISELVSIAQNSPENDIKINEI